MRLATMQSDLILPSCNLARCTSRFERKHPATSEKNAYLGIQDKVYKVWHDY